MIKGTRLLDARTYANVELLKRDDGASWDITKTCLAGTRVELVENLVKFASSSHSLHRIAVVTGVVGCGKTTIAHTVAERCYSADPRILSAAFMFSREVKARNTPELLVSTIVHALCGQNPALARAVSAAIEGDRSILSAPIARQFRSLLLEPLKVVSTSIDSVVIVIDALDEGCDDGSNGDLLKVLANDGAELPPYARIIVTSRPLPKIMTYLSNRHHIDVQEIDLQSPHNLEDIAFFARYSLAEIRRKQHLPPLWPGVEVTDAFIHQADGLFVWVSTACDFLRSASDPDGLAKSLAGLEHPSHLSSEAMMVLLYNAVLAACPWDDDNFAENYQLLLGTILTLKTPLPPLTIESILGVNISITATLRFLSPVLTGITDDSDGNRPLQISHDSFRGFLSGRYASILPADRRQYLINLDAHNRRLTLDVLRLLNRELPLLTPLINEIDADIRGDEGKDIHSPPIGTVSEPVWYCCQQLVSHLTDVTDPCAELVAALCDFMQTGLSSWIMLCYSQHVFPELSTMLEWYTVRRE